MLDFTRLNLTTAQRCFRQFQPCPNSLRTYCPPLPPSVAADAEKIVKLINDHPFSGTSLNVSLSLHILPSRLSARLVDEILGGLFSSHSNGVKALDFFNFCLRESPAHITPAAFDKTLHILVRMHCLDEAWDLLEETARTNPSFLTLKSMSLVLLKVAKSGSYADTVGAFRRMEMGAFSHRAFGTDEFNILLLAFSSHRRINDARSAFQDFHSRFPADTKTMNILLLGFKNSGNTTSVELFYREMLRRGFSPDAATHNVRIDALCKRREFGRALTVFREMGRGGCAPTVETVTTLIHGGGIAGNVPKSREIFEEMRRGGMRPDAGAYNALISSVIRGGGVGAAARVMDEMEEEGVGFDETTYHTMLFGLMKTGEGGAVGGLVCRMVKRDLMPGVRTVVMLMKFLCRKREVGQGLGLWRYLIQKGQCPHTNTLHLLVMSLCARGRTADAVMCSRQMLERGRCIGSATCSLLESSLVQAGVPEEWKVLDEGVKKLRAILPSNKVQRTYEGS